MQKKKLITAFLVLLFVLPLVSPTFTPKIAHSQDATSNETQVACGDIVEGEFINNAEDHIYLLPMQPRESFEVTLEPAGDDLKTLVAIYGPSGIRIKISGEYLPRFMNEPDRNVVSQAPKLVSGKLSATGFYKIRVTNTAIIVQDHQDMINDKLIVDNRYLGGIGAYTLYIGCTKADQITRIEPGDTAQPAAEPTPTPKEQAGAQTSTAPTPVAETLVPFLEGGKTYEIAFGSQTMTIKLVELRSDGWAKVEVDSRSGWLNINQVALIIPLN